MRLNIDATEVLKFRHTLELISKSALPVAVRGTLNKAAYNTKKKTLLEESKKAFINRSPNFFKANSRVEMAQGFDISTMQSTIGMVSTNLKGGNNHAVKDLEDQEHGGSIGGRSFIPTAQARGGNPNKNVRPSNRITALQNMVNVRNARGKTWAEKAIKTAVHARVGGIVMNPGNPGGMVWRITSIKRAGGRVRFRKVNLYSYTKNRDVKVAGTHFMRRASMTSGKKIEDYFIEEARRQITKLYK
ncbi:MAG: hypothetical protein H7282_05015 [Cytophagaceae bacterium]|nr:hypothetical protein [Cytophagaceae bacterium]